MKKLLTVLLLCVNVPAWATIEITPKVLANYVAYETQERCEPARAMSHGVVKKTGTKADGYSIACKDGREFGVVVLHDRHQTAYWLPCDLVAQNTEYRCFKNGKKL